MPLTASRVIQRTRKLLDQVPMVNEDVSVDSSVIGSPSTDFSNENLLQRVNAAVRFLVGQVKASHIPAAIVRYEGPFPDVDLAVLRPMFSRVLYSSDALGSLTLTAPYDLQGYWEGTAVGGAQLFQFVAGRAMKLTGASIAFNTNPTIACNFVFTKNGASAGSVAIASTLGTNTETFPDVDLLAGDIFRVIAGSNCNGVGIFFTFPGTTEVITGDPVLGRRCLQRSEDRVRRLEVAGRAATANYPVYSYEDGFMRIYPDGDNSVAFFVVTPDPITFAAFNLGNDTLVVDERFEAALVAYTAASCYQTMRQPGLYEWALGTFQDEIDPYATYNRTSLVFDDREVSVI